MSVIKGIVQSINFSPCSEMIKLNRLGVIYQELFQFRKPHSLQRERVWSHYNHQGVALFIDCVCCHGVAITSQHVSQMSASYYLTTLFDSCIPWQQLTSYSMTRLSGQT